MGGVKIFLGVVFMLIVLSLLTVYYLEPFTELEFTAKPSNYNFTLGNYTNADTMQFYDNMRFPEPHITYNIDKACSLRKKQDMRDGFNIIENRTILDFKEVADNGQIAIACNETNRYEKGMFIAGEGGPTKIVKAGDLSVIFSGTILLIRDSNCGTPNVAIHELLHVLGFRHSENPNNIMYNFTKCTQTIGEDTIELINEIYSLESLPDLAFDAESTNAVMHSRYLDLNITVRNNGLKDTLNSSILVIVDEKEIQSIPVGELSIGGGKIITAQNIWITKVNPNKIDLVIDTDFEELNKENNIISFEGI